MDNANDTQNVQAMLSYGMLINSLILMLDYSVKKNKTQVIQKLSELLQEFQSSLSEDEKSEYKQLVNQLFEQKAEELGKNLQKSFTPEEQKQIMDQLKQ